MAENDTGAGAPQSLLGGAGAPEGGAGAPEGGEPGGTPQNGSLLGGQPPAEPQGRQSAQAPEPQGSEPAKNLDAATQYEKFTVPEGFDYDDGKVSEFTTLARELNLSQEQAQKLVDLHVRHWLGFEEQTRAQAEEWRKQNTNNPECGGEEVTGCF